MDPVPHIYLLQLAVKTIRKSRPYVTWYRIRLSNKSLSIISSFKVVNLMKNDAQHLQGVFFLINCLSGQCSYAVHNTTIFMLSYISTDGKIEIYTGHNDMYDLKILN